MFGLVVLLAVIAGLVGAAVRPGTVQGAAANDPLVVMKLDEILRNQKTIMADLASLKEELRIVKIRVTQAQ
jgi:hypothetical protein